MAAAIVASAASVHALCATSFYRRGTFVGGSLATLIIALIWFAERTFDLKLISA